LKDVGLVSLDSVALLGLIVGVIALAATMFAVGLAVGLAL
jgi:hypothetical protein